MCQSLQPAHFIQTTLNIYLLKEVNTELALMSDISLGYVGNITVSLQRIYKIVESAKKKEA